MVTSLTPWVNCKLIAGELGGGGRELDQHAEGAEHYEIQVRRAGQLGQPIGNSVCYHIHYIDQKCTAISFSNKSIYIFLFTCHLFILEQSLSLFWF